MADMLTAVDEWRPDLIVRETMEFASAVAAVRYDVPQARVGVHLDSRIDSGGGLEALAEAELGVPVADGPLLTRAPGDEPGVHRFRTEAPLRRAPELVYVTFGSEAAASHHFPGVYRAAIDALAGLPVLVTIGDRRDPAELGPLPARTLVERWLDQSRVMSRAAVVVSHGGSGTTLQALATGVPQVFVPLFVDGPANARRVEELGAGIVAGDDLRAAVMTVLDGAFARAARAVADEIAALPPVDQAIEIFARLTSQARTDVRRYYRSAAGHAIR
jgi:UDP:flavonoid glycosyltransferase YjiC (YdhE family)